MLLTITKQHEIKRRKCTRDWMGSDKLFAALFSGRLIRRQHIARSVLQVHKLNPCRALSEPTTSTYLGM